MVIKIFISLMILESLIIGIKKKFIGELHFMPLHAKFFTLTRLPQVSVDTVNSTDTLVIFFSNSIS